MTTSPDQPHPLTDNRRLLIRSPRVGGSIVLNWDPTGPIQWPDLPSYEVPERIDVEVYLTSFLEDTRIPDVPLLEYLWVL